MASRPTTRRSFAVPVFALATLVCQASGDPLLEFNDDSLTTQLMPSASLVQDVIPRPEQRGVGIDGSRRAGWPMGMNFAANPFGGSVSAGTRMGDVNLVTGTYEPLDIDIALPDGLVIGRSYNARQDNSGHRDSAGYQGNNWFQIAQPEIVLYEHASDDAKDVVYVIYGADRYIEFKRTGASDDTFKGKNGTAGVVVFATGATNEPDTYTYYDPSGNTMVFFGFDTDAGAAKGQFWKRVDPSGDSIFAGHETTASDGVKDGYDDSGRLLLAYDSIANDGRRYTFSYNARGLLEKVEVETKTGGAWASPTGEATVARSYYEYYGASESYGSQDDLRIVKTRYYTSDNTTIDRCKYYRYWSGTFNASTNPGHDHAIQYVVDYEGVRALDWSDSSFGTDLDTISETSLKPYAAAYFEYDSSHRINKAWFNGECGCAGGGTDGTYEFTYGTNAQYSDSAGYTTYTYGSPSTTIGYWKTRTVVEQPDGTWRTNYFDEVGQALSRVTTDSDPSTGTPDTWVTEVVRDSDGLVTSVHTPANITAYDEDSNLSSEENRFTRSSSAGLVMEYERVSSGDTAGLLQAVTHKTGDTGTAYYDAYMTYATRDLDLSTADLTRATIASRRSYHDETSSAGTSTAYDETTFTTSYWSATATNVLYLTTKQQTTTMPSVVSGENGNGTAVISNRYLRKDGTTAWVQRPAYSGTAAADLIYDYSKYEDGVVTETIRDADTTATFVAGDDPNGDWGIAEASSGKDLDASIAYDAQARPETNTAADDTTSKTYRTMLADRRIVTLRIPRVVAGASTTYYGPVSYTLTNQAGRVEFSGVVEISSSGTTTALTGWIDENDDDPITALDVGTLARMNTSVHAAGGTKIDESRRYFLIPASGDGTEGTNFDATYFGYDEMGRRERTKDPTGTITRMTYDELGRVIEQSVGTNDADEPGTDDMVIVSKTTYDSGNDGGNSYVTKQARDADGDWGTTSDTRETEFIRDDRGRVIVTKSPLAPHALAKYDNAGRLVASGLYSSHSGLTATSDPTSVSSNRLALNETFYTARGQVWKRIRHEIDASDGSKGGKLETHTWYDDAGRVIKTDGEQLTKTIYDRLGRATNRFVLASDNDAAYADTDDVAGDIVLHESQTYYEDDTGNALMRVSIERHWDDYDSGETTGALDTDSDLSLVDASEVEGRVQISAMWYDADNRLTDAVQLGTNGGSDYDRDSHSTPPARSSTVMRTTTAYNDDGTVLSSTDPLDLETRYTYDDAGRRTLVIANYVNGTPSGSTGDDDLQTRYEFTDGLQTKMWVDIDGDGTEDADDQVTTYSYGTTKGTGIGESAIASGRLLDEVEYPDSASSTDVVSYAYNALSEQDYRKDQAGNVFDTTFDDLGRATTVTISTVASGFDSAVRRIETAYTNLGQIGTVIQYDATSGGNALNEVNHDYDGWGNLLSQTQDHDTPAGAATDDDYEVSWAYETATSGRNTLRRTSMTVKRDTDWSQTVDFNYSSTGNLHDDEASRVTSLDIGATTIAEYDYNGAGTLIRTELPEPDVFYSMDGSTARSYDRLDRFNRPTSSIWTKDLTTDVDFYSLDVVWDEGSNVVRQEDNVHVTSSGTLGNGLFDEDYDIDDLNRLASYDRGHWGGSSISGKTQTEDWTLDQLGNWDIHKLDLNGDDNWSDTDEFQDSRTHNTVNELTDRDLDTDNDSSYDDANYDLVYDAVGNLTDDGEDFKYVYDPLGRLVEVKNQSNDEVSQYEYDGLNRRVAFRHDEDSDGDVDDETWYHLVYDERWRVVATFRGTDTSPKEFYAHHAAGGGGYGGSSYIDSVVLRDQDPDWDKASDGTLERRIYYCQNWRADVSVVIRAAGKISEWVKYDPYGVPFNIPIGDLTSDGATDGADNTYNTALYSDPTNYPYDVRGDNDLDGDIDLSDFTANQNLYFAGASGGREVLSLGSVGSVRGYAGYCHDRLNPISCHVRFRTHSTANGRWSRRDPLDYLDAPSLYNYGPLSPIVGSDALGLAWSNMDFFQWYLRTDNFDIDLAWVGLRTQYLQHYAVQAKTNALRAWLHQKGRALATTAISDLDCTPNSDSLISLRVQWGASHMSISRKAFLAPLALDLAGLSVVEAANHMLYHDWMFSIGGHLINYAWTCEAIAYCCSDRPRAGTWTYKCSASLALNDRYEDLTNAGAWLSDLGWIPGGVYFLISIALQTTMLNASQGRQAGNPYNITTTWSVSAGKSSYFFSGLVCGGG